MSRKSAFMNNAATDFEGWSRWLTKLFRPGVAAGMAVVQKGTGANMSVDVSVGDVIPMTTNLAPYSWSDAVENVTIGAASANNRRDIVVAYVNMSVTNPSTSTPDNPGALTFAVVQGASATSPSDPSAATIQAAVGAANPYVILARVSLTSTTAQITNAQITNLAAPVALNVPRLWGGPLNTLGHLVPNFADDTVALLNAVQTVVGKTISFTGNTSTGNTMNIPYKFSVYRAGSYTTGSPAKVAYETKEYDDGNNVDTTTNVGRFTATVPGNYCFSATNGVTFGGGGNVYFSAIFKNGVEYKRGATSHSVAAEVDGSSVHVPRMPLAAGDYVEVYQYGSGGAGVPGASLCWFQGGLVSNT